MNTEAIVTQNNGTQLAVPEMFRDEQIETLKQSICKGATDVELDLFVQVCNRTGLDPFARQIFAVKRWDGREKREVMSVQVSIDGFRLVAQRSGKYRGQLGPFWCAADGVWRDVWLSPEPPAAAKVAVLHADFAEPLWAVARFDAYAQTMRTGELNSMWAKMGDIMIAKCFDEQTEVLTDRGFQKFSEVDGRILQVTSQGLVATDSVPFSQEYHGDMIQLDSDDLNFSVTPNHDMITTEGKVEAGVMFEEARSRPKFSIPRSVKNNNAEYPITDEQLVLCAAILSDGQELSSGNFIIAVSRERKVQKLEEVGQYESRRIRKRAGYVAVTKHRNIVSKSDQDVFVYSKECVAPLVSEGRTVDTETLLSLSQRQAKVLTDAWVFFDGSEQKKSGVRRFYTSRTDHLGAFELAAVLAGYAVSNVKGRMGDISRSPNFCVTISDRDAIQVRRWGREHPYPREKKAGGRKHTGLMKVQNGTGRVWCVTVPSGVIVVRRNGFSMICGNCAEALALRKAFPNELSGLYTNDEMAQADNVASPQPQSQPQPQPPKVLSKYLRQMVDNARAAGYQVDENNLPREWYEQENAKRAALLKEYSALGKRCKELGLPAPRAADPQICVLTLERRIKRIKERIEQHIDDERAAILEAEAAAAREPELEVLEGEEVTEEEEFPATETPKTAPDVFKFTIPEGTSAATCRSCSETIYWIKTRNGKNMPVNPDGTSHFSSCPNAEGHRREPVADSHIKALFATINTAGLPDDREAMIAAFNAHLRDTQGFKPITSRKQLTKLQCSVLASSIESGHLKW